jgi:tetratricopeptide (TPR) repeat protein
MPNWKRLSIGTWIIIAACALIALGLIFGAYWITRSPENALRDLAGRREKVAAIFEELSSLHDVDVEPLIQLEEQKRYADAASLLDRAIAANNAFKDRLSSLSSESDELLKAAREIETPELRQKAEEAFEALRAFAEANREFYEARDRLYQVSRDYYQSFSGTSTPSGPEDIRVLADAVESAGKRASDLRSQFEAAVEAFDKALTERK